MSQDLVRRSWRSLAGVALGCVALVAGACERTRPTEPQALVPIRVTAVVVGVPIATLVVQVTASDIPTPLVFNLTVVNGVAAGTIKIPPGPARTIDVTALDAAGNVTHEGSVTIDVKPGQNPPVQIKLGPRSGHVPITVTFGNYGVVVTPAAATIDVTVAATLQLAVTVTDVNGELIAAPEVGWATTNPAVATVTGSGLVTGVTNGDATIVATYEGVAGMSAVTVTGAGAAGFSLTRVAAGSVHTCGVTAAGAVYCWGSNGAGQLGDGTLTNRLTPRAVSLPAGVTFASVAAGVYHSCGVTAAGAAYCWGGDNSYGELGDGATTTGLTPTAVTLPAGVTFASVAAGVYHTCGVTAARAAYCWGDNSYGQLGDGTTTTRLTPTAVSLPAGVTFASVVAGFYHSCGVTAAGGAYCWGDNSPYGQLGDGTTTDRLTPTAVTLPAGVTFASVTAGYVHSCGVTAAGAAYCWGYNGTGQLGDGTTTDRLTPTAVSLPPGVTFASVTAGAWFSCGLTAAGAAYCWGDNFYGQLGDGTTTTRLTPTAVSLPPGETFARVTAGDGHSCGLTAAGAAYCWGFNLAGQLGDGTTTDRLTPVAVVQ